jgi:hypothetical protein
LLKKTPVSGKRTNRLTHPPTSSNSLNSNFTQRLTVAGCFVICYDGESDFGRKGIIPRGFQQLPMYHVRMAGDFLRGEHWFKAAIRFCKQGYPIITR